jgi:ribulose-phosphate 3-epimerase
MLVTPSILTNSASDAFSQIDRLLPYFKAFQIDIADGNFVPNTTISIPELAEYIKHHNLAAKYKEISFDFHLMVNDYLTHLEFIEHINSLISINVVMIHSKLRPNLSLLKDQFPQFVIGLVINPEETVQEFTSYYNLSEVPFIQIMSVNPGFQGAPFIPESLNKIEQLRKANYRFKIYLDGGINAETLPVIFSQTFTPDVIGPGSYLSKAEDIQERVHELNTLIEEAK